MTSVPEWIASLRRADEPARTPATPFAKANDKLRLIENAALLRAFLISILPGEDSVGFVWLVW